MPDGRHARAHDWESLIGVAAHELRHPLHLMRLALARQLPNPGDPGRQTLERYIDRMSRIVGDLTDLVRIDQDAMALQRSWLDVTQMLREIVDAYHMDAAARHVSLTLAGSVTPLWIQADAERLQQVLSNVLDNALKFTPENGSIKVVLVRSEKWMEIRVNDNGRGIASDALPHVFDLFATSVPPRGLGVGLTVARRIVDLHGGSIELLSDGVDHGTEVVIRLPVSPEAPGTLQESERFEIV